MDKNDMIIQDLLSEEQEIDPILYESIPVVAADIDQDPSWQDIIKKVE